MSFIYSRALVEESSGDRFSDIVASAPSNSTHTPKPCLWHDKTMAPSRLSQFGMTCAPLTESPGAALLMSYLVGSRARTLAQPEKAPAWTETEAGSGRKWLGLLATFVPGSSTWKTPQCSLLGDSEEFSETWPRWGSMRNGESWERGPAALPTTANASGWSRMWPTPVASMHKSSPLHALTRKDGRSRINDRLDHAVYAEHGGPLNPEWTELLMGWPIGHTALRPLATGILTDAAIPEEVKP